MSAGRALVTAVRIAAREERTWLLALPVVVGAVTAVLAPNYATTYDGPAALATAVTAARANDTLTFLYGRLAPDAGTVGMATWELGALTSLALAALAVLRGVARTRGAEDAGRSETLRALGARAGTEAGTALLVLVVEAALGGTAAGLGLLGLTGTSSADAVAYGGALAGTSALCAAVTVLVAPPVTTAPAARGVAALVLAGTWVGYGFRAARGSSWAAVWGSLSPFALRPAVGAGVGDDLAPLAAGGVGVLLVGAAAALAAARRDLGAGLVALPRRRRRPLHVAGPVGLTARLALVPALAWSLATAGVSGLLVAMGRGVVDMARRGGVDGGSLGAALGGGDPAIGFLRYAGVLAGALAATQAVALVCRFADDERSGRLEVERAAGAAPARLLGAAWLTAVVGAGVGLALSTVVAGAVGSSELGTGWGDAVRLFLGQLPAAAAAAGVAALLCALRPRLAPLAWLPVLGALGVAQLGATLGLPGTVVRCAPLAQAGRSGSVWLAAVALVGVVLGVVVIRRRDLAPGSGTARGTGW